MPFRFRLNGLQIILLIASLALVTAMTFGTGLLWGVRSAEREGSSEAAEALSDETPGTTRAGLETEPDDRNGAPQLVYEIQLSSHLRQEDTTPVVERLLAAGYQAFVVETRDSSNRSLYTVRIGPWSNITEAAEAAEAFRDHSGLTGLDPKIRHRPKPATPGAAGVPRDSRGAS